MNLSMKQKQTHRHREQTCGCQGQGMDWEFGVSRCKLLHIEWMYIQCLGINHNGKEYLKKECVYVYN